MSRDIFLDNSMIEKEDLLLESLKKYYTKPKWIILNNIVHKRTPFSLRIIEFFVSNYARDKNVSYKVKDKNFYVYSNYKVQLESFQKKHFDLFRRHCLLSIETPIGVIDTTIGQMNFFRWLITNDVLDYITKNLTAIKRSMDNETKRKNTKSKKDTVIITTNKITINF